MISLVHTLALEAFRRDLQSIAPPPPAGGRRTLSEAFCVAAGGAQATLTLTLPADVVAALDLAAVGLQADHPDHDVGPADVAAFTLLHALAHQLDPNKET